MIRQSCSIKLVQGTTGELVDAVLFEGLSQKNINDHENIWVPALEAANKAAEIEGNWPVAEDAHWRWGNKVDPTRGQLMYRHYAIEYEEHTEGLMKISLVGHQSKIDINKDIVYIDYLSVAPQNRAIIQNPPKFRAVGSILLQSCVQVSIEEGIKGRIGFHALPKAISWYQKKGFTALGRDPSCENLEYFELTEEGAKKMIDSLLA